MPCLQERPDLADLKNMLVVSNAKMKADLAGLESKILELLSNSSGNILEDEALINMLAQAKVGLWGPWLGGLSASVPGQNNHSRPHAIQLSPNPPMYLLEASM